MIEKIKYITNHPSGKHSAEASFPQVQKRIQYSSDKLRFHWWKYAAAASIALLFTAGYYVFRQKPEKQVQVQIRTYTLIAPFERDQFVLPDGTLVGLNAGSRLTYTEAFGDKTREVEMIGEAYFEVRKDPERPFIVNMNKAHVQVLGTIFNIRAYPDNNEIITTLVEGSVKFNAASPQDTCGTVLQPGQQLFFYKDNERIVVRDVDCPQCLAWKDRKLVFRKTTVKDAFAAMEQTFRIKILTTNTALYKRKITGSFDMDEKPEDILSVMQESLPFDFEVKVDTIIIK